MTNEDNEIPPDDQSPACIIVEATPTPTPTPIPTPTPTPPNYSFVSPDFPSSAQQSQSQSPVSRKSLSQKSQEISTPVSCLSQATTQPLEYPKSMPSLELASHLDADESDSDDPVNRPISLSLPTLFYFGRVWDALEADVNFKSPHASVALSRLYGTY